MGARNRRAVAAGRLLPAINRFPWRPAPPVRKSHGFRVPRSIWYIPFCGRRLPRIRTPGEKDFAMDSYESDDLLARAGSGDELAAAELYDRYVDRLIHLARKLLSPKLARRTDPEDIVQSAFRSFFRHVRAGRYGPQDGGDLWRLLAAITVGKLRHTVRRHTAEKRSVYAEQSTAGDVALQSVSPKSIAREPTPDEAAVLVEETELAMCQLSPLQRQVLQFRLQGHTVDQTALHVGCSERTVHRVMKVVKTRLEERLLGDSAPK